MSSFYQKNRVLLVIVTLFLLVLLAVHCTSSTEVKPDLRGEAYAGSERCQSCHAAIYQGYAQTAHAHTSQPPAAGTIRGSFEPSGNQFDFQDGWKVVMEKKGGLFYQTAYQHGQKIRSQSFDVVVGSGRKAQTYLYYNSSLVYQLPISYFVPEHSWANSPNFPADHPKFDRVVPSGCFGCHSSGVGVTESFRGLQKREAFEKGKVIYGIDCERCHGPAAAHVAWQETHPQEKTARNITSIHRLNRQQSVDLCGLCHSGTKNMQQPAFFFQPGQVRDDYFFAEYGGSLPDQLDVHGNQYALLKGSRCFLQSQTLTCNSCHRPHQQERDNLAAFSQRCLTCHQSVTHRFTGQETLRANALTNNCIDCHMPQKASSVITLLTQQQRAAKPDSIRTHLIKIYGDETAKFLRAAKGKP